jgi:hypothetical protein
MHEQDHEVNKEEETIESGGFKSGGFLGGGRHQFPSLPAKFLLTQNLCFTTPVTFLFLQVLYQVN